MTTFEAPSAAQNEDQLPVEQKLKAETIKSLDKEELWDEIGFHKLLAGFWYNISYTLIGILISATLMGALMNTFYPFPESLGYKSMVWTTFSVIFVTFDLGTGMVMDRFIAKENISNPEMMIKYIQYFIWYQAITGLIQTTAISIYALYYVPNSNKGYAVWLMLVAGSTQYPGFLGVFKNVLGSLQHYNKTQLLTFLTGTLFQRLTEIGFVYLGKLYGQANPAVGEMMGIAIGGAIGLYVDDFFAMLVSASFFSKVLGDYNITPWKCLRVDFTWKEVKEPFYYGLKTGAPGLFGSLLGFLNFTLWVNNLPQYTTYVTLAGIGSSIPGVMNWFGTPRITPLISESYLNGKHELTRYYVGQYVRFYAQIQGFFIPILIVASWVLPIAWEVMGMVNYIPGLAFVIPGLIFNVITPYLGIPGQVMYAANRPNFAIVTGMINNVLNTLFLAAILIWWKVPEMNPGLIPWLYICFTLPQSILIAIINYGYLHTRILRLKIPFKQIIFGFVGASLITFGVSYIVKSVLFDPLNAKYGFYISIGISIFFLLLAILLVYFPVSALLGAWDDENLKEFEKAAFMSGPSKIFVIPVFKMVKWMSKKSPLHNKFAPDMEIIEQQARELLLLKKTNREDYKKSQKD